MTAESGAPGLPEKRKSGTRHCKVPQNISCLFPYVGIIQIRFRVRTKQSTLSRLSASSPFSFLFQYFKTFNVMCQEQPRPALRQARAGRKGTVWTGTVLSETAGDSGDSGPQRNFSIFLFLMKVSQNPVSRNRIDKSVRIDLADHFRDTFYVRAGHD